MNIEFVTRDVVLNEEVQQRIRKKLEKILERRPIESSVRIVVEEYKGRYLTKITMPVPGKELFGHSEHKNMVAAIDEALERIERQYNDWMDRKIARKK